MLDQLTQLGVSDTRLSATATLQNKRSTNSGMTSKHVSELERGVKNPSFAAAQALAKALGINVADFNGLSTRAPSKKAKGRR